jgi:hypothetical protein
VAKAAQTEKLPDHTLRGLVMSDSYEGDGYEFSIRLPNYQRLWIHVTRAALEALNKDQPPADQLSVLTKQMPLLHKLALQRHAQDGGDRIVVAQADLRDS